MKILHVASFNGNLGDVLSHRGLYQMLQVEVDANEVTIIKLDIRRFYKNSEKDMLQFNGNIAKYFNEFDLVIIGGGGFLKQSFNDSLSGNTFDFDPNFYQTLKTKIVFYSIGGMDALSPANERAYSKTERFLEKLHTNELFSLIYRNDGSVQNSQFLTRLRQKDSNQVLAMNDSAYLNVSKKKNQRFNTIIINIGYDQAQQHHMGLDRIILDTAEIIKGVNACNPKTIFKFIPHTYYDVQAYNELCLVLPEQVNRNNMKCLETFTFETDLNSAVQAYTEAELALTGRFHSTAFALLYTKKFLPLYSFARSSAQLTSLGLKEPTSINSKEVNKLLNNKINNADINFATTSHQKTIKNLILGGSK